MYVVLGVTGKVGGAVAHALLERDLPVRAVVRDERKGTPWADLGCEVAVAELDDAPKLARAFADATGVFSMLPPIFDPTPGLPEATGMVAVLRAALAEANPERVVALSTVGADQDRPNLLNQLRLLEQALETLTMPVTFLRPAWFMENAAGDVGSARDAGLIRSYLQPLDRAVPMVASADVGRTAAALLQEEWAGKRIVELEAERRVSPDALADAFSSALGRPVRAEAVPRAEWEAEFRDAGMKNPMPRIRMIDGFNEGWIDFPDQGKSARKGSVSLIDVIAELVRQSNN